MNRVLKGIKGTLENRVASKCQRLKFLGLKDPMDIPSPPEDGSEPPAIDEERKAKEFKLYDEFAVSQKNMVEELSADMQVYYSQKVKALGKAKALWAVNVDPEAAAKLAELEDLRKSQIDMKLKEEEERRQVEAAAAKGGKKSGQKDKRGDNKTSMSQPEDEEKAL